VRARRRRPTWDAGEFGRSYRPAARSTFASNALAARITVFELARVMGTSVEMIERHNGALLDGSGASMTSRLALFEAEQERAAAQPMTEAP
jgi:hypothetical protein